MKLGLSHFSEAGLLSTSAQAQVARSHLETEIAAQPAGAPIELDFGGVHTISVTFADECIGRVLGARLAGYDEDHPIFATGANRDIRRTLAAALRQRRLSLLSFSHEGAELLGADETLEQTMELALELESFGANDVAGRLGLSAQAANNRLVHLVRVGALTRARVLPSRGGREFRYTVPSGSRRVSRRSARPRVA